MNPNEIKKLKEKAPFPIIILIVLFFLPALIFQPEKDLLAERISAYQGLLKKAKLSRDRKREYEKTAAKFAALTKARQDIFAQLPDTQMLPQIIDNINALAVKNSVNVGRVTYDFNETLEKVYLPFFNINMQFEAYYENMRRFVADLESLQYPLLVEEIVVSGGKSYRLTLKQLVK